MAIRQDGFTIGSVGGGSLEEAVIQAAPKVLAENQPRVLSFKLHSDLGMLCGGTAEVFIEPMTLYQKLYIFGAGHIGQALCRLSSDLAFQVTVIDDRANLANPERFPHATAFVHSFDPQQWQHLTFDNKTFCVIVTPDHQTDLAVVQALINLPCQYLGMIGSKTKRRTAEKILQAQGIAVERIESLLRSPIGLPIGAETPEEIAISIMAELIQVRRKNQSPAPKQPSEVMPPTTIDDRK